MGNINQYKFEQLPGSEIVISKNVFDRLVSITNLTALFREEHMCFLRGREILENKIYFDEVNSNTDYEISGSGSTNPYDHGVSAGKGTKISKEIEDWIKNVGKKNVICDVHTHPSGIASGYEYRMYSGADLESSKEFTKAVAENNITHLSGLISVDNEKGNSTISFVWFDEKNKKFWRVQNISVAHYKKQENKWELTKLPKSGNSEFIEMNFGYDRSYER